LSESATAGGAAPLLSVADPPGPDPAREIRNEAAKTSLAQCARTDECVKWADKAAALASYAKQAGDDSLWKMAVRIRARAIERCGYLLRPARPESAESACSVRRRTGPG